MRLGYVWGSGKYEAAIFGRNISNQIRVVGGIDFNHLTGFVNEPRAYGAQFKATLWLIKRAWRGNRVTPKYAWQRRRDTPHR